MVARADRVLTSNIFTRAMFLAGCWWAVTEGDTGSWTIGVPAVAVALILSLRLHPPQPLRLLGLAGFLPVFLWRSLAGGLDVACRALAPHLPLRPALIEFRTRLPAGLPRVVFANVISLLPGTLSADLEGDRLSLHVLSAAAGDEDELRKLEGAVARLFA